MSATVERAQRFTRGHPCPICGGFDSTPRGHEARCFGFLSEDGKWAHCTREDHAGDLELSPASSTYAHRLEASCKCGVAHGAFAASTASAPRARSSLGEIVARYAYRDESGKLLFEAVRYLPKTFRQRRPDSAEPSGWTWDLKGVRRVLYRLPELLAADTGDLVFIVEGEKDVDSLRAIGFEATCNPMGALKWHKVADDAAKVLRGRPVVIIPDQDDEGRAHAADVGRGLHGVAASVQILELPGAGKDASDWIAAGGTAEELVRLAKDAPAPKADEALADAREKKDEGGEGRDSQATRLVGYALAAGIEPFHSPEGDGYVSVAIGDHVETWPTGSQRLVDWLSGLFYDTEGKIPSGQALSETVRHFSGCARLRGPEHPVYLRTAPIEGGVCLDLGDDSHRAIEVRTDGWKVVARPQVHFRRGQGARALPEPTRGGSLDRLRDALGLDHDMWILALAWLVSALCPDGPYPVFACYGEEGAGKSTLTLMLMLRRLVDPHAAMLRRPPKEERDLVIAAKHSHVVAFNNLSRIEPWLSDALCCLSTGSAFGTRKLHTDDEEVFFTGKRPVLLNGINDLATRGDLLSRTIAITFPAIPEKQCRDERTLWAEFDSELPGYLGALLDVLVRALAELPRVKVPGLPRMADFALLGVAVARVLGCPDRTFLDAYARNQKKGDETAIESSPIAVLLLRLVEPGMWVGTATELLRKLTEMAGDAAKTIGFPKDAAALSRALRRLAPALRRMGVEIKQGSRTAYARTLVVTRSHDGTTEPSDTAKAATLLVDAGSDASDGISRPPTGLSGGEELVLDLGEVS